MSHARRLPVAFALMFSIAGASPASAFDFPIHVDITRAGLKAVVDNFVQLLSGQPLMRETLSKAAGAPVSTFTPKAAKEIEDANQAQDTMDCGDKDNLTIPAAPCLEVAGRFGTRTAAGWHLLNEPEWEHFDGEQIPAASDFVVQAKRDVIDLMKRGQFVGARKRLGQALHALQDFYSHTNYVELGYRSPEIEKRIGWFPQSFLVEGNLPRMAYETEVTCLRGQDQLTSDKLKPALLEALTQVPPDDFEQRQRILGWVNYLTKAQANPKALLGLTSGFFTLTDTFNDPKEVAKFGKCLHGFEGVVVIDQAGVHKDVAGRALHLEARTLATVHTAKFVAEIMTSIISDPEVGDAEKFPCIVGLLGWEPATMMSSVTVGVPGAPNGASWDTALSSVAGLLTGGIQGMKNIQPDVRVCMESGRVPGVCLPTCVNADWSNELNAYVCKQPVDIKGWGTLVEPDLRVTVRELSEGQPTRLIANFRVEDPRVCDPFCSLQLDKDRTIWIRFDMRLVKTYAGPQRLRQELPPGDRIPVAKPASATNPWKPISLPVRAPTTSSSLQTAPTTVSPPAAGPAAAQRALAPTSLSAASGATSSAAPTSLSAASAATRSAAPLLSAEGIDARLALRDADNCVGSDAFFPASNPAALGSVAGPVSAAQLYHMAAFSMAITDATAKKLVLNAIQAKAGTDAFFTVMTAVIGDPVQSQQLATAYQSTAQHVVDQVTSNGLTSLLPAPKPPSALLPDVDRWILSGLSSPAAASAAIDLMSNSTRPVTAECTLNELAKRGFTATVLP